MPEGETFMPCARKLAGLAALALVAVLCAPAGALAAPRTWMVDDASGSATSGVADNVCNAPGPAACTISEAVLEANSPDSSGDVDSIHFTLPANTTIALQLNVVLSPSQPMIIDGCSGIAATNPCVGIDGAAVNTTPIVVGDGVTIS